ncbi:MAG: chromate efflux transporter [Hyphomicrobium sp.]
MNTPTRDANAVAPSEAARPTFTEALRVWAGIGVTSFGGPAGQIALMHKRLVDDLKWLDERTFLLALNFCTLLPGPEAMQLATYAGWRMHGIKGGLAAGLLFVLPGAFLIALLAWGYAVFGSVPLAASIFLGIKAAVLAIVVEALLRISKRALKAGEDWVIAALAFIAIFFFKVPFPIIIFAAGLFGFWRGRRDGALAVADAAPPRTAPVKITETLRTVALWLAIWLVPLGVVALIFGGDHVFTQLSVFFSKLAVVTFGGAYAVLAYMAQDVVETYGWLKPGEMLDGLGLAETTPGPLILVTEFVGFLASYRASGTASLASGLFGALVTLWATFAPCFLWIFAGAPYVERIAHMPRLKSALAAITAAVVGVILNLSVWFALHVSFRQVNDVVIGPMTFSLPNVATLDPVVAGLAVLAAILVFRFHVGIMTVLAVCGALSFAIGHAM